MFGLGSLSLVRDYVYGPQGKDNTSILAQENDRHDEFSFLGSNNGTGTLVDFNENSLEPEECLSQSHKELAPDHSLSGALKPHFQSSSPLKHNSRSNSLPLVQANKTEHTTKYKHVHHQANKSTKFNSLSKAQLFPPRQISSLAPAIENRGRAPSQAAQSVGKVRRLSPLREFSGIADSSAVTEQPILVVQKTRTLLQPFLRTSKPSDRLCKSKVPDCAFKPLLPLTSSFSEDFTNSTTFGEKHRKLSSQNLRGSFYHNQPISRTVSLSSLRHLPPSKEKTLYIGVDAHKIFFLPQPRRSYNETVKYRQPPRKERQIPVMTPYAIFSSHNSDTSRSIMPTMVAFAGPTPAVDITGERQRSSSDVSSAGSFSSNTTGITGAAEVIESSYMNPGADRKRGQFFDDLALALLRREEARRESFPTDMESMMSGFHTGMESMMGSFQASSSNSTDDIQLSPHAEQTGTYFTFSDTLSTLKMVSVNSETNFLDEATEVFTQKGVNFMPDMRPVGSSTASGSHSTTDSECVDRESFWLKLKILFAGCFGTH